MSLITTFLQIIGIAIAVTGGTLNYLLLRDIKGELKGIHLTLGETKEQMLADRVCPFCGENNSFKVSDPHSTYFCFSCRKYGNTTRLVDDSRHLWEGTCDQ
jgi:phage FluMu protein Com